jgi:hypothetical protein
MLIFGIVQPCPSTYVINLAVGRSALENYPIVAHRGGLCLLCSSYRGHLCIVRYTRKLYIIFNDTQSGYWPVSLPENGMTVFTVVRVHHVTNMTTT